MKSQQVYEELKDLAEKLGVNKSRVSQIFSNPGNLTLRNMIEWSRAVNLKLGILAYDDEELAGDKGPVSAWVFLHCWDRMRKPRDMDEVGAITGCHGSGQYQCRKVVPCQGEESPAGKVTWDSMVREDSEADYSINEFELNVANCQ